MDYWRESHCRWRHVGNVNVVNMKLEGRTYVVTGAAGGIGQGISEALLAAGANVLLTDIDEKRASTVRSAVDPSGDRTLAIEADLADSERTDEIVKAALGRFKRLDGLVNNAGIITMDTAWDAKSLDWTRQLDINVTASFTMAQAVGRHLRTSGGGSIVNVASNCGKVGYNNMAAYNASKAAVISLTRSLAAEWAGDNINVNAVCPGAVDTPMLGAVAKWLEPVINQPAGEILNGMSAAQLGRKIKPIEVGRVVAFLLSDEAVIIRGQSINVDGGDTPY
jgi:NAD(P)-dependent dehydrogenase (short-subunit alcohol dehydrogenase family)